MADASLDSKLVIRLSHPHYYLNSLLCLVFPILLLTSAPESSFTLQATLLAAPVVIALSVAARQKATELEFLVESASFQLRLFNLFGLLFTRTELGLGKRWIAAYVLAWLLVSFFFPQPGYLGPHNLKELTSEEFDAHVLLLPPAQSAASAFAAAPLDGSKIVELADDEAAQAAAAAPERLDVGSKDTWNLVLFHVDFSNKSRELEMTLARLSARYTSPTLQFSLLTPETASTTFYDLGLSASATSIDLPLLRMYRGGRVVQQAPLGEDEARERRREVKRRVRKEEGKEPKRKQRRRRRAAGKKAGEAGDKSESESGSGSDTDSEDEREVQQEVVMSRYRWDRSAEAIVTEFGLRDKSGVLFSDPRARQKAE
ncbi:hypothetical protein JCM11641_007690 [Rhodosporidiobolus odoratus]